jgi:hypothetical protein
MIRCLLLSLLVFAIIGCGGTEKTQPVPKEEPAAKTQEKGSSIQTQTGIYADARTGAKNLNFFCLYIEPDRGSTDFYVYNAKLNLKDLVRFAEIDSVECAVVNHFPDVNASEDQERSIPVYEKIGICEVRIDEVEKTLNRVLPWPYCIQFIIRYTWRDKVPAGTVADISGKFWYKGMDEREKRNMRGIKTGARFQP